MKDFTRTLLRDIRVRLSEEFDRNFERQRFFDGKKWQARKSKKDTERAILIGKGSGHLRKSIRSRITAKGIHFYSNAPYASIHNEGFRGTEQVRSHTRHIRRYARIVRGRKQSVREHAQRVGSYTRKLTMPQRQFIGDHPKVRELIKQTIDETLEEFRRKLDQQLRQ